MTTFSVPVAYSITSSNTVDTVTLTTSNSTSANTITLNGISSINSGAGGTSYIIGTGAGATVSGTFTTSSGIWNQQEEFVNCMPELTRVKNMCEEYPGLRIAYEKFVTTYKLVKDDYDTPKNQRPKP